jgi:hypothetical protein
VALYDHIRADPLFKNVTILYIFENNMGNDHNFLNNIVKDIKRIDNVFVLYENDDKIGFNTSEFSKLTGYDILKTYASVRAIKFYRNLITINAQLVEPRATMKAEFISQMADLKQYAKMHPNGRRTQVISGIHGEDKKRIQGKVNDINMAFMMLLLYATKFNKFQLDLPYKHIRSLRTRVFHHDEDFEYIQQDMKMHMDREKFQRDRRNKSSVFGNAKRQKMSKDDF